MSAEWDIPPAIAAN
jgi:hypothetical protein